MWSKLTNPIDNFLNQITMYRLVLYVLIGLSGLTVILAGFHLLPFSPIAFLISLSFILLISKNSNNLFAKVFNAPTNVESVYITALILSLIISPVISLQNLDLLFWAALLATASKYILAVGKQHIFNPAAIAIVLTAIGFNGSASWWIGNAYMAIPVTIGSFLIIRKLRRQTMINYFLFTVIFLSFGFGLIKGINLWLILNNLFLHSSLLFFTGIMLTEPLTSPSTKKLQSIFGALVGFFFVPQIHFGNLFFTPEHALIIGNFFSYMVNSSPKLILTLKQKIPLTADTFDFIFLPNHSIAFTPGQYMEWTLPHRKPDQRGNRRYFTLASSPTEKNLRISVKFPPACSSFKQTLLSTETPTLVAAQLSGDFTLPQNPQEKIAFIAGGIGITPFRSMIKYLIDTNQKRDLILIYVNRNAAEIVYQDIFNQAQSQLGIKTSYYLTSISGHFNQNNFPQLIPDYHQRKFYISGPHLMVSSTESLLKKLGIKKNCLKTDFFPGFV